LELNKNALIFLTNWQFCLKGKKCCRYKRHSIYFRGRDMADIIEGVFLQEKVANIGTGYMDKKNELNKS